MFAYTELLYLLSFILLFFILFRSGKGKNTPPGPSGFPIIGNLHRLAGHKHRSLFELSKRYGPLMYLRVGSVWLVIVSSAEMAEEILKKNDIKVSSRPCLTPWKDISYDFSDIGFSPYSDTWKELRKIAVSSLLSNTKVDGFRHVREKQVEGMIASISSHVSLSKPVNISMLLHSLSYAFIDRIAFGGRSYDNFHVGEQQNLPEAKFHSVLKETQALLGEFFVADYIPWARWVDDFTGLKTRLKKTRAKLEAYSNEIIEAHISSTDMITSEDEEDLVDALLRLQKNNNNLSMDNIKGVITNLFLAGTFVTHATMEYAMAELVKNPHTLRRAQEEVRDVMGSKGNVQEEDLHNLKYLKSVVKETLRLHPPGPLLVPRETMDNIVIHGYKIPTKTRVLVNAWAIGRDPNTWRNPDEFMPERFMDSPIDFRGQHFELIPFGSGRRMCPAVTLAIIIVELTLANLLYAFDWEHPQEMGGLESFVMEERDGLACGLRNDLHLRAIRYEY